MKNKKIISERETVELMRKLLDKNHSGDYRVVRNDSTIGFDELVDRVLYGYGGVLGGRK